MKFARTEILKTIYCNFIKVDRSAEKRQFQLFFMRFTSETGLKCEIWNRKEKTPRFSFNLL